MTDGLWKPAEATGRAYRVAEGTLLTSGQLMTCLVADVPGQGPPPTRGRPIETTWYCHNENCQVRQVTICRHLDDGPIRWSEQRMLCPSCRERLELTGWVDHVTLLPDEEADSDKPSRRVSQ